MTITMMVGMTGDLPALLLPAAPSPPPGGGTVPGDQFATLVRQLSTGLINLLEMMTGSWVLVGAPRTGVHDSILTKTQELTLPLTVVVATIGVMVAGTRMVVSSTRLQETGRDLLRGLLLLAVFGTGSVWIVTKVREAFDAAVASVVLDDLSAPTTKSLTQVITVAAADKPGVMFVLSVVGMVSVLMQFVMLLLREPALAVLTGLLPVAAGASMSGLGRIWLMRIISWIAALVIYKFVAAVIYATAFGSLRTAKDLTDIITCITLIIIAVAALPILVRLLTPTIMAMQPGGGSLAAAGTIGSGAVLLNGQNRKGGFGDDRPSDAGAPSRPGLALGALPAQTGTVPRALPAGARQATGPDDGLDLDPPLPVIRRAGPDAGVVRRPGTLGRTGDEAEPLR